MALCSVAAQAQNVNAIAVGFTGGDTSGPSGFVNGVLLDVEVISDQFADRPDFRSMSLTVDVDCRGGREKVEKAAAFDLPNLAGPPRPRDVSGDWIVPEAYMREAIQTICTVHGMRFVEHGAGAVARPAVAARPTSPAEPLPPSPPAATADHSEFASRSAPPPAPSPDEAPSSAPAALVAAPPREPSNPDAAAGFAAQTRVQIASSPSRADAQARLDRSADLIQPPLKGEVEVATVHGRTVYRSIIAPFRSPSEAQAFCARMRSSLDGCFVWQAH